MKFTEEKFTIDVIGEMGPLTVDHIAEVGPYLFDFLIDWDKFVMLQEFNSARLFVAREGKTMVGYSVYLISPHTHFATTIFAMQDALYLVPDHRGNGIGTRFIRFCEEELSDSCDVVTQSVTPELDFTDLLLKSGYVPMENVYMKNLKRTH